MSGVGKFVVAVLTFYVAVLMTRSCSDTRDGSNASTVQHTDPFEGFRGACMIAVKGSLHDPASAEFGDISRWTVIDNRDGTYSVGASFSAKNGFNAVRQSYTTCIVRRNGGNIDILKLSRMQ